VWGAAVLAVDTLVFALVGPYAGTVVDRLDRRRVIVVANTVAGVAALLLVLVRSEATAWIALVAISVVAAAKAFSQPAGAAALPNLVDAADLPTASVLAGASWGTMLAVGAALGGLVAGTLGTTACFVIDAVLLLLAAGLTAATTRPFSDPAAPVRERRPVHQDVGEAVGYARRDAQVLSLLTCKSGPAFGNGALSLFPLYGAAAFGLGPLGIGSCTAPAASARCSARCCCGRGTDPAACAPCSPARCRVRVGYLRSADTHVLGLCSCCSSSPRRRGANWVCRRTGSRRGAGVLRGRVFSADYTLATLVIAGSQVVFGCCRTRAGPRAARRRAVVLLYAACGGCARASAGAAAHPTPGG
jgi:hypothetical protein